MKDTVYKLTTKDYKTRKGCDNECKWGPGVTHSGTGKGALCSSGYIHAYLSPLLAVFLNPVHADIPDPVLWECITDIAQSDNGLKVGGVALTTIRELPVPVVTKEQRVAFSILCTKQVVKDPAWNQWADNWLSGKDRTESAAESARAGPAGRAAAWAGRAAAWAAAESARAGRAAAWAAAESARAAAWAAAESARAAARAFSLQQAAEEALKY